MELYLLLDAYSRIFSLFVIIDAMITQFCANRKRKYAKLYYSRGKFNGLRHHARDVERALKEIALRGLGDRAIAVEIAIPLAVFLVRHALICPFAHLFVPI